ncbi:MAG: glycosyltransferase family A protein [bacterium]|nr:glycosyltransferase family A protein [bacterium]
MKIKPTYSIGIPVYNRVFGFEMALESAIAVKDCSEIIVVDDNSNHTEFESIVSKYNDPRIKYFRNIENIGLFGNWNKCIEYASSEYVSILCSDDIVYENIFTNFMEAFLIDQTIEVFFGSFATFKDSVEDSVIQMLFKKGPMKGEDLIENALNDGLGFPVLSVLKREVMLKMPFVSKPHSGNDWLWIYSNATKLNLFATDKPINFWRRHENQDAIKNQSITRDCWPLMFINMSNQLKLSNPKLARKAILSGRGFIITTLLNESYTDRSLLKRVLDSSQNDIFIEAMQTLISEDWLLKKMIANGGNNKWAYQLARIFRKIKLLHSDF